jgi:hypothetical protein
MVVGGRHDLGPVCVIRLSRGGKIAQELLGERCSIWYEPVLYTSAPMYC